MDALQEQLQRENWKLVQFSKLGLGIVDAKAAVDEQVDYHELEAFLAEHPKCDPHNALEIVR